MILVNEKIIIVGARRDQLPGFIKAKEMGFYTIGIDNDPIKEALPFINLLIPLGINDWESILPIVRSHDIKGVLTLQTDSTVRTVGKIVDELGLSGSGYKISDICTNKSKMSEIWKNTDVPCAKQFVTKTLFEVEEAADKLGYPVMIKPIDNSGSIGVTKVTSKEMLQSAFSYAKSKTASDIICVEEFLEGEEFGAQVFVYEGECQVILLHNDTSLNFTPIGHSMPCKYPLTDKTRSVIENSIQSIGITSGACNLDLIMTDEGPKILELAVRMGSNCLPELIEAYSGINWIEASILNAIGMRPNLTIKRHAPAAVRNIDSSEEGILKSVQIHSHQMDNSVALLEMEVEIGEWVKKIPDRVGRILVTGNSWREAEESAEIARHFIDLVIDINGDKIKEEPNDNNRNLSPN